MSKSFDRVLVNPDERSLRLTLQEACGQPWVGGWWQESDWQPILEEMSVTAEGRSQLEWWGSLYLVLAWWTDHRGQRRVLVASGSGSGRHRPYSRRDEDARPPLWHLYPERIFRVHRAGRKPVWLASCACGVTGPPETLAWMGPCCGPCHDRREEGNPLPAADRPTILYPPHGAVRALAFSPDGETLAVSSAGRQLNLHDLRDGGVRLLYGGDEADEEEEFRPVVFSPDGLWVAVGDQRRPLVRLWSCELPKGTQIELELSPGEEAAFELTQDEDLGFEITLGPSIIGLTFSPDGGLLGAWTDDRSFHQNLCVWQKVPEEPWQRRFGQWGEATSLAFSPEGGTLAIGGPAGTVTFFDTTHWQKVDQFTTGAVEDIDVLYLEYVPGGDSLVLITGRDHQDFACLRLWNLAHKREEHSAKIKVLSAVAMSPDGRYLAWITHHEQHSPAEVSFWDLQKWQVAGALEWDPEDDVRDLAFSPDGQTLATGSGSGIVKLFPWRLLLEA